MRFLIIFPILLILSSNIQAREYELGELIDLAKQNSINIKAAEYEAISQKQFANQQKYWDNPTISASKIGNQNSYSITQAIPFYNKRQTSYNSQKFEYEILETRKKNLSLTVQAEVFSLLYQYQALKQKIALNEKRLERLSLVDKYLINIVLVSPSKKAQWLITKDRIRLVKRDLIKFRNQLYQIWNMANLYLNLEEEPSNVKLAWLDDKNYQGRQFFIDKAMENNLKLKEQKILVDKSNSDLSLAKIEIMPDFNLTITQENGSGSSNKNISQNSTGAGLSMSLPLINRNQEKIAAATSKIKAQELILEFKRQQLIQTINNEINNYETTLLLAKNFPINDIGKIILQLNQANSDFKKGILDFITYIELDSQEYQIIDAAINSQIELAESYSQLMIKIGNFTLPK